MAGVQDIYVALFGRPADPEGLAYWNSVSNNGADLSKMLAALPFTNEYTSRFAGQSSEQIVSSIYQSLFGRAPDALGLKFFSERLASGEQTIATIAVNIAQGAQGTDKQTFDAKVTAAELFTKSLDTPAEIAAYKGDVAAKTAQGFLSNVDKDRPANQDAVDKTVVGVVTGGVAPGGGGSGAPSPYLPTLDINKITDPLFGSQWYLKNNGDRGTTTSGLKLDMNIAGAWLEGYTGKGVKVAINDDGIDLNHVAFRQNLLKDLTHNPVVNKTGANAYNDPSVTGDAHGHGTVVGSIVGMAANDGVALVGVAPDSKLVSGLALEEDMQFVPQLFNYMTFTADVDVSVNSYGRDPAFAENFYAHVPDPTPLPPNPTTEQQEAYDAAVKKVTYERNYLKAIEDAAKLGRGGLGVVIEYSSGNEQNKRADAGMTGTTNNKHVITVGSVNENGVAASYSTGGSSILVSALGGEDNELPAPAENGGHVNRGYALATADLSGDKGDNKLTGAAGDFSFNNYGTSYSGPIVGATAALMLQANPNLGFRDVANILAMTARHVVAPADGVTLQGDMVNFGGLTFSRAIGYGLVDISAAVRLAASWTDTARTVGNWVKAEGISASQTNANIPQDLADPDTPTVPLEVTATVSSDVVIERMEFDLDLTSIKVSQLKAVVESPSGTKVVLFDRPMAIRGDAPAGTADNIWPGIFQIGSTAFLGERSAGEWKLTLIDTVNDSVVATYNSLTVRAWGSPVTTDSRYVLTDAFAGTKILSDAAGIDLINGAAVSTAMLLDLHAETTSTIAPNKTFTIATGTVIENVYGGAANDVIYGNAENNVIRGNGGADELSGYGGSDTFVYANVHESHVGAADRITDFEVNLDYIDLRFLDANVNQAGNQHFQFGGLSNTVVANGVVFTHANNDTIILADVNGDATADVKIILTGTITLAAGDFLGLVA